MSPSNYNSLWGQLIAEELSRNGIRYCCISPGSRSTPLTVSIARHKDIISRVCLDERGAAFHALGYARATGRPAALICTSGTAAANYFPAIVEAYADHIPLIVLSADRPPELRETHANQTILQPGIYGNYVRWQFDLPCPTQEIRAEMVLTTIDQLVHRATTPIPGPVHLNCMFREPLLDGIDNSTLDDCAGLPPRWKRGTAPFSRYSAPSIRLMEEDYSALLTDLEAAQNGLLVVGGLSSAEEVRSVAALARQLNWPLFADITSGLRLRTDIQSLLAYFDQLLLSTRIQERFKPDLILRIGGRLVSKRWLRFCSQQPQARQILINPWPERVDAAHQLDQRLQADIALLCGRLVADISGTSVVEWLKGLDQQIDQLLEDRLGETAGITEPGIARAISKRIAAGHALLLAASMPIRDMDMYAAVRAGAIAVAANRGASGIDGTLATAIGYADGLGRPCTLLIGDLALLHDLNSLQQLAGLDQPLTIVLINNNGGGIFSFLPIVTQRDVFAPFFETPHGREFRQAAAMFEIDYQCPESLDGFISAYQAALTGKRHALIEVHTSKSKNLQFHTDIQAAIVTMIDSQS